MENKPQNEWKLKKGLVVECIRINCKKEAFAECLCMEHYDEENKREK